MSEWSESECIVITELGLGRGPIDLGRLAKVSAVEEKDLEISSREEETKSFKEKSLSGPSMEEDAGILVEEDGGHCVKEDGEPTVEKSVQASQAKEILESIEVKERLDSSLEQGSPGSGSFGKERLHTCLEEDLEISFIEEEDHETNFQDDFQNKTDSCYVQSEIELD